MNHDTDAQTEVVLCVARQDEGLAHGLKRIDSQDRPQLLVALIDDVPVNLCGAHVYAMVELDVEAAAEGHREARLVGVKVADAEDGRQLRAVNVLLLVSEAEERVREGLEARPLLLVVLELEAAEVVLHGRIYR